MILTSKSGVERKFPYSTERHRITARGERWCGRHLTPTSAEPTEQWMDGWILVVDLHVAAVFIGSVQTSFEVQIQVCLLQPIEITIETTYKKQVTWNGNNGRTLRDRNPAN